MEELLLELLLALHELDVVDEQHVDLAVATLEVGLLVLADGVDELVEQRLGRDVADPVRRVVVPYVLGDRLQQVGLAQSRAAVDEQRVVATARGLGHRQGGGMCEAVGCSDHERVEGVSGGTDRREGGLLGRGRAQRADGCGVGVGEVDRQPVVGIGPDVVDLDLEDQSDLREPGIGDGCLDHREVALLDALADELAGNHQGQDVVVELVRVDVLEGRGPHGVADLFDQERRRTLPDRCTLRGHEASPVDSGGPARAGIPERAVMMGVMTWSVGRRLLSTGDPHLWTPVPAVHRCGIGR